MLWPNLNLLAFSLRDRLATMSWLEMILWFGLASLTCGLLVLMSTRWGQVRPVSKCVALSVFAHVLFLTYAYGTNLHVHSIGLGLDATVRVSLTDDADDADWEEAPSTSAMQLPPGTIDLSPSTFENPAEDVAANESEPETSSAVKESPEPMIRSTPPEEPPPLLPEPDSAKPPEAVASSSPVVPEASPPNASAESEETVKSPYTAQATQIDSARDQMVSIRAVAAMRSEAPRRPVDDQPVPRPYRLRTVENRLQLAIPFGATEESEEAVQTALSWLASVQSSDGRWDASDFGAGRETKTLGHDRHGAGETADTGITGLALLAFLGAGQTHVQGDCRETVQRGLEFLLQNQASDGNLGGPARLFEKMYCHGIASLALGEAFALTGDPRLQPAIRKAVAYSVASQNSTSGGWRYQPGDSGDMSQFGWQVMALRSAELGGLAIDSRTRSLLLKFLESATSGKHGGLASYRPRERQRPTRTMTAEAMACRFFLDRPPTSATANEATDFILQELPGHGQPNMYYWYYATLALYQDQGPGWQTWNEALQKHLIPLQHREGRLAGSWDTDDVWGGYGGRVYTTAMGALCLEVYYRYLPLYDQTDETRHAEAIRSADPFRR